MLDSRRIRFTAAPLSVDTVRRSAAPGETPRHQQYGEQHEGAGGESHVQPPPAPVEIVLQSFGSLLLFLRLLPGLCGALFCLCCLGLCLPGSCLSRGSLFLLGSAGGLLLGGFGPERLRLSTRFVPLRPSLASGVFPVGRADSCGPRRQGRSRAGRPGTVCSVDIAAGSRRADPGRAFAAPVQILRIEDRPVAQESGWRRHQRLHANHRNRGWSTLSTRPGLLTAPE